MHKIYIRTIKIILLICLLGAFLFLATHFFTPSKPKQNDKAESEQNNKAEVRDKKIVKVMYDEYCPYYCEGKENKHYGYIVDILRVIFEREGYNIEFLFIPYKRCLVELEEGRADIVPGAFREEVEGLLVSEVKIGILQFAFFANKKSNWNYHGVKSLESRKSIGISGSYYYLEADKYLKEHPEKTTVLFGSDQVQKNLKMLAANRIDAFPEDRVVANYFIKKVGVSKEIREAGNLDKPQDLLVVFTPGSERGIALRKIYEKGLIQLRNSGELAIILKKYSVQDWE